MKIDPQLASIMTKDYTSNNQLYLNDFIAASNEETKMYMLKTWKKYGVLSYCDASEEFIQQIVEFDPTAIIYIKNPKYEILEYAIKEKPSVIHSINNISDDLIIMALKLEPKNIRYINNPSKKVRIHVLKTNPEYFHLIKGVTNKEIIPILKENPAIFDLIKNPTVKMQFMMLPYFKQKKTVMKYRHQCFLSSEIKYDSVFLQECFNLCESDMEKNLIKKLKGYKTTASLILEKITMVKKA